MQKLTNFFKDLLLDDSTESLLQGHIESVSLSTLVNNYSMLSEQ